MPPFDLSKLIEIAPLIAGAMKPGSPEAAAMMRGFMRSQEAVRQRGQQDEDRQRQRQVQDATLANLERDNARADEAAALARQGAQAQRYDRYRAAAGDDLTQLLEHPNGNPADLQAQFILKKAALGNAYGVTPDASLPNMGALVNDRTKKKARGLIAEFDKEWGKRATEVQGSLSPNFGEFAGKTFAQIRQIAEMEVPPAPPGPVVKEPDKPSLWVMKGTEKRYVTPQQAAQMSADGWAPYEKGDGDKPANGGGPSYYSTERANRTIASVDELLGQVNRWTVGVGSTLSGVPESAARDFKGQLDTLKANIAFNELTAMREASKTGGALGAVSERELALLSSALGALDQGMSPKMLKAQLQKIKESVQRWQVAVATNSGRAPLQTPGVVDGDADSALEILNQRRQGL